MRHATYAFLFIAAAVSAADRGLARPVFVAETPGHTKFMIDDATIADIAIGGASVRQARVLTRSAPDPHLVSGQVAAESVMQFNCAARTYREWSTVSIGKDGSRKEVVKPMSSRPFHATRDGSFERKLLDAACAMRKAER